MSQMFEWDAADYAAHSSGQLVWAKELIGTMKLNGWESVLDLGCGDGKATALLAEAVPDGHVVGIDNSKTMIDLAQAQYSLPDYANLSFQLIDATELPFDSQFDVIFSNAVLHWVPDQMAVLLGVNKALRPGGRLLFQMGGRGNAAAVIALLEQMTASDPWKPYFENFLFPYTFPEPADYQNWLLAAGMKPVRIILLPKQMYHLGESGLAGWIRTTWLPYLKRLPASRREEFVNEFVQLYVKLYPADTAGNIGVAMVRLQVEAES